jgi:hypothetical protein
MTTAIAFCPDSPLEYPKVGIQIKLARLKSGGLHMEHIEDLIGYCDMALVFIAEGVAETGDMTALNLTALRASAEIERGWLQRGPR